MRNEAQKASRRKYEQSEKGKIAKQRHETAYKESGGRALTEKRRSEKPISEARKVARLSWAKRNPEYFAANKSLRRTLYHTASDFDQFVLIEAMKLARLRRQLFDFEWHVDHVIPVSKGGTSEANNLQVVPAIWNRRKSNKHTEKFFGNT